MSSGSSATHRLDMMPRCLRDIDRFNPPSYQVDPLPTLIVQAGRSAFGLGFDLFAVVVLLILSCRATL